MSSLNPDEDKKWVPTHVQVTVMKGRGLRGKGKNGTSDVYTIIQLGKEKYSTCVVEKTTEPEWREECTFELQPGALECGSSELVLTVMHRALIGLDVFLGQAVIPLDRVFTGCRGVKNEWYRLNSKTGKKEKERGDIQVSVQFTRNNLTASMYDLVMKDKSVSTFFKLKERIKGKRRSSEEDSSSAILPGGYGSLVRMRQRLPSDGGGEEYYEDDEGGEVRRSKMRTFFLRGKLRKSSDTRSSTSLGSESSESSSRGGSLSPTAGISVVVSDLSNSPSNSSNLTADNSPEHTANTSPKLSSPKCEFGDEAGEITIAVPQPKVCVNGSHSLNLQPLDSGKPAVSLGLGLLKPLPLSMSLQNLSPRDRDLPPCILGDGRRWSFDKPDEEEKAAIVAALEQSGPMLGDTEEESLGSRTTSSCTVEADSQGRKQKRNLFSHSKSDSTGKGSQSKDESELALGPSEDKHRGWFGSKDSHSKPSHSLVVSRTADLHPHPFTWGCTVESPLHYTNPFSPSQSSPPPLSPSNPFFTTLHNPFYKDMCKTQLLNPSLPPLPFLSSARPPITTLFPDANTNVPSSTENTSDNLATSYPVIVEDDAPSHKQTPLKQKSSNSITSDQELDSEWDQSFDEFAAGRLQSPEDLTTDCKTQQNTSCGHALTHSINTETTPLKATTGQTTNDSLYSHPMVNFTCKDTKDSGMHHFFSKFLDTIPENSLEYDNKVFSESSQTPKPNADVFHDSNCEISSQKFSSSSPDPTSSGLGSSAEEDGLSCFSSCSASDKLSSSEETEVQHFESSILGFEKPPAVKHLKTSESEEDFTDKSEDISLGQQIVIEDYGSEAGSSSPTADNRLLITKIQGRDAEKSNCYTCPNPQVDMSVSPPPENELSLTLPAVFVTTSSPGRPNSPFESTKVAEQDQLSPVPVALFSDFPNTSSIGLSPDSSLTHTNVLDRSSYAQSLYESADSQEYQTCLTHATSGHPEISVNSTLCTEQNSVQMANNTATDLDGFFNFTSKEEVKPPGQTGKLFGEVNAAAFETNFTEMDRFSVHYLTQDVVVDDMFSNHLNGGLFIEPNNTKMTTETDNFFKTDRNSNEKIQSGQLNGGLFGDFSRATFETNFTEVDDFNLQSGPHTKQEVVVQDVFSKNQNGVLVGDVIGNKFESNFTAPDGFILHSNPISPKQDMFVEDVFSKNPNGGFFDDWAGAKIESDYTAADSFSLQCSKQEGVPEDMFSKHLNTGLFGDVYRATFVSNCTTADDFYLESTSPTNRCIDDAFPKHLEAEHATLHRSQSEGMLVPAFDELQPSIFGSDPGAIQESASSFKPQPDLLLFSPFIPSLTPQCSSSPLALCPPAPVARAATPGSPTGPIPALAKSQDSQQQQAANHFDSPHPVKPLTTATAAEEKRTESRSVLEKLKFTINPGRSSQAVEDSDKKKSLTEGAGSYYHLTHSELVALLVQREAELERQKTEFERQKTLLVKRETELRKLKPQVRDLEDYIDTLLVRIMEQKPTLLQVRSKFK